MRRVMIGLAVGALALALAAPGASAAPPREDAIGDVTQPKGDIVTGTYSANFTDIFLTGFKARVTLRQGTNPLTTGAWRTASTGVTVQLDTDPGHTGPERSVRLHTVLDGPAFVADVTDLTTFVPTFVVCAATATFTAPNIYKVQLGADCLPGEQTQVRARFRMRWDTPPSGGVVSLDKSPDVGWGSLLQAAT
ncbi:MAG: hypothetical protein JNK12_17690 [Acidimicrobiales bacterium]|nr:hypothetical protein [Acidimicrobiales bacterium]